MTTDLPSGSMSVPDVSSVYILLMCVVLMCISLCPLLCNPSGGIGSVGLLCFLIGLIDWKCCCVWNIFPLIVSVKVGQYLVAFWYVSPDHESNFPALIDFSQVSSRVVPAPDGTIYLVDINGTHYWGSI